MRLHRFQARQFLPISVEEAWDFFGNPSNLALLTPAWLNLKPTCDLPDGMHPGLIVTYNVKPALGIAVGWMTEITHVVEGKLFVDEQRAGPYRFWHHQHHFRAVPGGTETRDIVHYALPLGIVGDLAGAGMVARRIREIFAYRNRVLEQRFGTDIPSLNGAARHVEGVPPGAQ